MGKIVIHAGTPKAGSSAIQHWLAGEREATPPGARHHPGDRSCSGSDSGYARSTDGDRSTHTRWDWRWMKGGQASVQSLERFFSDLDALSEQHPFLLLTSETLDEALWRPDEGFLVGLDDLAAEHSSPSVLLRPSAAHRDGGGLAPVGVSLRHASIDLPAAPRAAPRLRDDVQAAPSARPAGGGSSSDRFGLTSLTPGNVVVDFARHNLEVEVRPGEAPPINRGLPLEVVNLLRSAPRGRFWSSEHDNRSCDGSRELFGDVQIPESAEVRRSRLILQAFCHRTFEAEQPGADPGARVGDHGVRSRAGRARRR